MKSRYHREITRKALADHFSEEALQTIIKANIGQDKIKYQFGHPYIHFDSNAFEAGFAYISQQEDQLIKNITQERYTPAREALGRILHAWQDFYSHSNYIRLWVKDHPEAQPEEIDPADPYCMDNPDLRSGEVYGLMEFLALLPVLTKIITPLMPDDSHAKMNLDSPDSGDLFSFNKSAAFKRTVMVYERIRARCVEKNINPSKFDRFIGKHRPEEKV
jgi:hypothetical protein